MSSIKTYLIASTLILVAILASSCDIKDDELVDEINTHNIITIYTKCHNNSLAGYDIPKIRDHYLFKIKEDRISLTEKHDSRIKNKQSSNLELGDRLKKFVRLSSDKNGNIDDCEYYLKCGINVSRLYPTAEEIIILDGIIMEFTEGEHEKDQFQASSSM